MLKHVIFCLFVVHIQTACKDTTASKMAEETKKTEISKQYLDYNSLRFNIVYGKAKFAEVKQALTETDVAQLTNTLHALYSMRWHRGVHNLYYDLWNLRKDKYPDFAWKALETTPARIALASTINRVQIYQTEEFKELIRSHKYDEHEFHRSQVAIALGLNGDPVDVGYLKEMADSNNYYVSQTAISSLALMGEEEAKYAMIDLYQKYAKTPRGDLLNTLLKDVYRWQPNH